ncbi:MAG: hypothetical protein K2W96_13295 [Gemmataceae bacterium]|nr:hypothetical protein [Gemmataceae bacterium]
MRGDIVYRVCALHEGREKDYYFGTYRTASEAVAAIAELASRQMDGRNWAEQYHNRGFVVREVVVETDFVIPPLPKPRDRYFVKGRRKPNRPGTWDSTLVEVFRRDGMEKACEYERNYSLLQTFEPFRQGGKDFALISRGYTRTAVLDLQSGEVVAEEDDPTGFGFCPVGFYVPDWWDVHDGSVIPGSESWSADHEWPVGGFGFVWGCIWGDDGSRKVQHLDLSRVQEGAIRRDERFGHVELATTGYRSPCLLPDFDPSRRSDPPHFIRAGKRQVSFAVEMLFDLESGKAEEWQRLRIANMG